MDYEKFLQGKIKGQEKENVNFPMRVWEYVVSGGVYNKHVKDICYYQSIEKKLMKYSEEYGTSIQELCKSLIELQGVALSQTLDLWAIKPERQNFNERWKKEFIENKYNGCRVTQLIKSGPKSLYMNDNFEINSKPKNKTQTGKSIGMKTFDFIIEGLNIKTEGYNGVLVVDKTTKVRGGSQTDVQREVLTTLIHLSKDPQNRKFMVILDGGFWVKFVNENKNKYKNIFVVNSNELGEFSL